MVSLTFEGHELNEPKHAPWPLWDAGFRVFFLGAAAYSVLAVLAWALVYAAGVVVPLEGVSLFHWHAQAMVYGYALAVVAGFLLTAIERWTGEPRLRGPVLGVLAGLWAVPRGVLLFGTQWITVAAVFDGLFVLGLIAVLAGPIVRSRSWKHMGVLTKLVFLGAGQVIFYVHAIGGWADGGRVAVYGGLYMLVGLTLVISRRVLPMFIARGVGYPVELRNSLWL
ncbi:MAG: NnrS family protein, partial [Algisphaera sp.]